MCVCVLAATCFIAGRKDGQKRSVKGDAVCQQSSPWMGVILALEQNSEEIVMDVGRLNGGLVP